MIGTSHSNISRHAVDAPRRHHGLASAAGVSLTELLMSVTLFSITVVGAIAWRRQRFAPDRGQVRPTGQITQAFDPGA